MGKNYSIGEIAQICGMTTETLRHYDRIGLVKPYRTDEWTGYRYYTDREVVRLNTVQALRRMDLPLGEIKRVLDYDSLEETVAFLARVERSADEKIAELVRAKEKIRAARRAYEDKIGETTEKGDMFVREFPARAVLLSDSMQAPSLENLWNYLSGFYEQVGPENRERFEFEDVAGVYEDGETTRLFAVCRRYAETDGMKILPAGKYLCADCAETNRREVLDKLLNAAREKYSARPGFTLQFVVISGILQWNYLAQVYIGR